jgi:type I restriction enzyme M protein
MCFNGRDRKNEFNLNISRYVSTAEQEEIIDIVQVNKDLVEIEKKIISAKDKHNKFLVELGLPQLP